MKVHHCIADGIAACMCSPGSATTVRRHVRDRNPTTPTSRHGVDCDCGKKLALSTIDRRSLAHIARRTTTAAALRGRPRSPAENRASRAGVADRTGYHDAALPFSLECHSAVRRKNCIGSVTINDVAVAAITDSFRTMLIRRGGAPGSSRHAVSVGAVKRCRRQIDNRVSVMLPSSGRPTPFSSCDRACPID